MKKTIGILGGGQLGRMLAFEAKKLGYTVVVVDAKKNSPAGQVADKQILAPYDDRKATHKLAKQADVVTVEIEHIDTKTLSELEKDGVTVHPSAETVHMIQDKYKQKKFLEDAHISVTESIAVDSKEDIVKVAEKLGYPLLLKSRFSAYDGRGNAVVTSEVDTDTALKKLGSSDLYVEKFVPFDKELAVMVARNTKGEVTTYPVVETIHKNNICHTVIVPAHVSDTIRTKATELAKETVRNLKGAGVFGIEMFLTKDGTVLVNEIAPRVHNSGHYTIEACVTSQFEQHIRAITGLPLGSTEMVAPAAVMINILGDRRGETKPGGFDHALGLTGTSVHIYGKDETRPERKMGHITAIGQSVEEAFEKAQKAQGYVTI